MKRQNLIAERKNRKMTQAQVAVELGITKSGYSNIENGWRDPSYSTICKLEALFQKPHSYLLLTDGIRMK